jgi:hypothetical protein
MTGPASWHWDGVEGRRGSCSIPMASPRLPGPLTARRRWKLGVPCGAHFSSYVQNSAVEALPDHERVKGGLESQVDLSRHRLFNVKPTGFGDDARRDAEAYGGDRRLAAGDMLVVARLKLALG